LRYPQLYSFTTSENGSQLAILNQDSLQNIFQLPLSEEPYMKYCKLDIFIQSIQGIHYYKMPLWRPRGWGGGSDFTNGHLVTQFYSGSSVMSPNRPSLLWPSVATVLGDITSSPIATVTILVTATSHRGCHTSPLLLRATTSMAIRVISPGPIATKGQSSDILFIL
jgi:hypothetical protein